MSFYRAFRNSIGRDGPDYSLIDGLAGADKQEVLNQLRSSNDYYDILALGLIGSTSDAEHLKRKLESSDIHVKFAAARAIWDLTADAEALITFKNTLHSSHLRPIEKIRVINLLLGVNHSIAFSMLQDLLYDKDYLVRSNAATIHSENSKTPTSESTIQNNLLEYDASRIAQFASKLSKKI